MALGQHRDTRHATIRLEVVQMDVQQRRARGRHALAQRLVDQIDICEALGLIQIDDQMHARAANAIADHKVVLALVTGDCRCDRRHRRLCFLSVGTWSSQALVRSQEGCLAHAVLPNQIAEPRLPASRSLGKRKPPDLSEIDRSPAAVLGNKINAPVMQEDSCVIRNIC